jgi:hypothetical protein
MRTLLATFALAATVAAPVLADEATTKGSDADDAFVTEIRKPSAMSGEAFAYSNEADRSRLR